MSEPVLLSDPRIAALAVQECGEPLVDLRTIETIRVDTRLADSAGWYAHVRLSIADRLVAAQTQLPRGLRLLIIEGYRPPELQQRYFSESINALQPRHPDWSDERLYHEASRYISPPAIAPHVAGAAVDLALCTTDGTELDMGTEVNATPTHNAGPCYTASTHIPPEAINNRAILGTALTTTGCINYPTEWWHWSFGDQYWAFVTGAHTARYGPARTTANPSWDAHIAPGGSGKSTSDLGRSEPAPGCPPNSPRTME